MKSPSQDVSRSAVQRQRNRRGEGGRLREQLVDAAVAVVEAEGTEPLSLRSVARRVGIAATSVYLHFASVDHVLAAVMQEGFARLTAETAQAASSASGPLDELHRRCRAYCAFGVEHPRLYRVMFQDDLPALVASQGAGTPGRQSFERLVDAVQRCIRSGVAPPHDDPFRLASLVWTAEHGIVLARTSRPAFPWGPLGMLVDEMVDRLMGLDVIHA